MSSGILLVDKPQGITSHDVVARTRRLAGTRRVGHAGTLDPMATGLLILGVNSSTRLLTYLVGQDKEYLATIRLGSTTTTDDAEGDIVTTADPDAVAAVGDAAIAAGVAALTGAISQVPSSVSAIKVDGKRAYALVRAGRGGRAEVAAGDGVDLRGARPAGCRRHASTWTSASNARPAPTSGRWRVTSAPPSASAVTSPRCAAPASGRST